MGVGELGERVDDSEVNLEQIWSSPQNDEYCLGLSLVRFFQLDWITSMMFWSRCTVQMQPMFPHLSLDESQHVFVNSEVDNRYNKTQEGIRYLEIYARTIQ